jgi:hypothetical protein
MSMKRYVAMMGAGLSLSVAAVLSVDALADSSIAVTGAVGEFENREDTLRMVSVGGFYEIGNTTMTAVDDLYGGYVTWHF